MMKWLFLSLLLGAAQVIPDKHDNPGELSTHPPCFGIHIAKGDVSELKERAHQDDSLAARLLALYYRYEEGNQEKYQEWTKKSAQLGNSVSQLSYSGILESEGEMEEGKFWLLRSASQGIRMAYYGLARMYKEQGNAEFSQYWMRKAALAGNLLDFEFLVLEEASELGLADSERSAWIHALRLLESRRVPELGEQELSVDAARRGAVLAKEFQRNRKALESVLKRDSEIYTKYSRARPECGTVAEGDQ